MMFHLILFLHSLLRYAVILLLFITIFRSLLGWLNGKTFSKRDRLMTVYSVVFFHVQLLLGFLLYMSSPSVSTAFSAPDGMMSDARLRFWAVEHIGMMLLSAVLITLGGMRSKKITDDRKRFRTVFWYFFLAALLTLSAIPWPFREVARHWLPF